MPKAHCRNGFFDTFGPCILLSGYGAAYRVCDPLNPRSCDEDTAADRSLAGGKVFSNAWMYDGNQWNDLPAMSTPRDRPACSLVESDNGEVSYKKNMIGGQSGSIVKLQVEGFNAGRKSKFRSATDNFRQARPPYQ